MLSKHLPLALLAASSVYAVQLPITTVDDFIKDSFDYLVLGGGTAGLVVASRCVLILPPYTLNNVTDWVRDD